MAKTKEAIDRKTASFWMVKAPIVLKEKFDEIARMRVVNGKDKKTKPYSRFLLAASRHPGFLKDLANADLIDDKDLK